MALLLLIRHALTEATGKRLSGTAPGVHLSDAGREQAEMLAGRLGGVRLAAIYSSPLERCVETAEPIARARGMELRTDERLGEVDFGRWTGRPLAQLARTALWKRVQRNPSSIRFPDGESLVEVQQRAAAALADAAARHPRDAVALVSHGDVIRVALAHCAGIHLDLFQRLVVSPASVSVVGLGDSSPVIFGINATGTVGELSARRRPRPRGAAGRARHGTRDPS